MYIPGYILYSAIKRFLCNFLHVVNLIKDLLQSEDLSTPEMPVAIMSPMNIISLPGPKAPGELIGW